MIIPFQFIYDITKWLITLLMFCMLCAGCDDEIKQIPITMKLSADMLDFESDGGERTITVETNTIKWKVESAASWIHVTQNAESKDGEIIIAVDPNAALTQKEATITVKGTGIETRTVKITIRGAPVKLEISTAPLHFPAVGGQQSFSITSNTDWTIGIDTIYDLSGRDDLTFEWLKISPVNGGDDRRISVTAAANPLIFQRTQKINVSGPPGVTAEPINVVQEGRNEPPYLSLSKNKLEFSAIYDSNQATERVNITSNTRWTLKWENDGSWIMLSISSPNTDNRYEGRGDETISISPTLFNTSHMPRSTRLSITAEGVPTQYIDMTQSAATVAVFGNNLVAASSYGGGNGTQNAPYLINNAQQLKRLVDETNKGNYYYNTFFKLMADIEVTANEWIPIGYSNYFRGNFDGNGHYISGLLKSARYAYFGFFGGLDAGARVSNLTMDAEVKNEYSSNGRVATGAIAGLQLGASVIIEGCYVDGKVTGGRGLFDFTGGIMGHGQDNVAVRNCTIYNDITGYNITGGIVGEIERGEVTNCTVYWNCSIKGSSNVGGIIGSSHYVTVSNCTNYGAVSNGIYVGGIVGYHYYGAIHTSRNTGAVSGSNGYTGGLAGVNNNNAAAHIYSCCTNIGTVNGQTANTNNQIGSGKAIEPCSDGHNKR